MKLIFQQAGEIDRERDKAAEREEVESGKRPGKAFAGKRASDPRRTGTATRSAACVAERRYICRNTGANAAINPHAAKHTANERVPRARGSAALGGFSEPTLFSSRTLPL